MNKFIATGLAGMLGVVALTAAAEESSPHAFSGNVALSTDYVYRGQSQTGNNPAVSGGFDYTYSTGGFADAYLGTWASNINFGGSMELDWYGGLRGALGDTGLDWDVGFLYYQYPGQGQGDELDFVEGHVGLSYTFADVSTEPTVGFKVHWTPDWQTNADDGVYYDGNLGLTLPYDIGLAFHAGYQEVDDNATWGTPDWFEWNVYLSKAVGPFTLAVGYHDTDLSKGECFGGDNICDGRVMFKVSAGF